VRKTNKNSIRSLFKKRKIANSSTKRKNDEKIFIQNNKKMLYIKMTKPVDLK
jgi:hypothetical protein